MVNIWGHISINFMCYIQRKLKDFLHNLHSSFCYKKVFPSLYNSNQRFLQILVLQSEENPPLDLVYLLTARWLSAMWDKIRTNYFRVLKILW